MWQLQPVVYPQAKNKKRRRMLQFLFHSQINSKTYQKWHFISTFSRIIYTEWESEREGKKIKKIHTKNMFLLYSVEIHFFKNKNKTMIHKKEKERELI